MGVVNRVLPLEPARSLNDYITDIGGQGLEMARKLGPAAVIDEVEASGLRGRGGAGFPTAVKWRTVAEFASGTIPSTVVVNGSEGEPGTFKDRVLMRANPYAIVEGALIAALAVGADRAVLAIKASFEEEGAALQRAIDEIERAGWAEGVALAVARGPGEYLFGEETALLEVLAGRPPFPRIAPPFRHGTDELGSRPDEPAGTTLAEPGTAGAPPTLANNVETVANVPQILARGAEWFRSLGTAESPGTIVCTISGATRLAGVAEVELGTPLGEAIEAIGGGPRRNATFVAAMSGVANPLLPARLFDTPLTYEDMERVGSGLGAARFVVFDDSTDLAAVAAGISHFLAVESCGQCTPCKQDGLAIAAALEQICTGQGSDDDLNTVNDRVATVADEARCFLAEQHQRVINSVLQLFPDDLRRHVGPDVAAVDRMPVAPIANIADDGTLELDVEQLSKQPDWSFDATDSGKEPVDRLAIGGDPDDAVSS